MSARGKSRRGGRGPGHPPLLLVVPAALGLGFVALPAVALVVRAPWSSLGSVAGEASLGTALWLSLASSSLATAACLTMGVPLGWVLARVEFPGRSLVRGLALLPLVLPPVVGGLALLLALGRRGLLGEALERLGVVLPFTLGAVVLAQAFVAIPFVVLSVEAGVRAVDPVAEDMAASLGASRLAVFRRITLPLAAPAVAAGAALAWARALGEFGATIMFAGSVRGRTQTLPLAVFEVLQRDTDGAVVLALALLGVSIAVLVALRGVVYRGLAR